MRVAIVTIGTRGDVQPYIALAKRLQAAGHDVVIGAPDNFASWVEGHGIRFHALGMDIEALLQSPEARRVLDGNIFAVGKLLRKTMPTMRAVLGQTWEAAREADVIVYHPKAGGAVDVAEATGAGLVCASPIPMFTTGDFPLLMPKVNLGRTLNRLTYWPNRFARLLFINRWRKEQLNLPKPKRLYPLGGFAGGMAARICMVSPAVFPRPSDWDDGLQMAGYWFLDEAPDWRPDAELAAFLDAGEPPVYIGFGSMAPKNPEAATREIVEGVRRAGVRALLAVGWGGLTKIDLPETVHMIHGAPHHALFPLMSAVVHHGGAGSTAAGLRAGRPTLVCPLSVDQPFWGHLVWKLGCGPRPQRMNRLKAASFAEGLRELVGTEAFRVRAREVAEAIGQEDGVGRAMEVIERVARR
ncbi:MAG: glycosyltransferase [Acidobacteria bacterium]|nr:glycosyltransferase [Acidobacteriota bacterium]MDA1236685.1 glycosyltransferase [Acidobacteriota bacterium]